MKHENDVMLDWDREADIMTVVRDGVHLDSLINIDSERIPGIVKRIDPSSQECVGLIIHGFSSRFPGYVDFGKDQLKLLLDMSLHLTNERNSLKMAC